MLQRQRRRCKRTLHGIPYRQSAHSRVLGSIAVQLDVSATSGPAYQPQFQRLASLHNFATASAMGIRGASRHTSENASGQPFLLQFSTHKRGRDSEDQKVLGNTKIIGQSGAGKTVLLNFLLAQSQKFKPTCCFFDKDSRAENRNPRIRREVSGD